MPMWIKVPLEFTIALRALNGLMRHMSPPRRPRWRSEGGGAAKLYTSSLLGVTVVLVSPHGSVKTTS